MKVAYKVMQRYSIFTDQYKPASGENHATIGTVRFDGHFFFINIFFQGKKSSVSSFYYFELSIIICTKRMKIK